MRVFLDCKAVREKNRVPESSWEFPSTWLMCTTHQCRGNPDSLRYFRLEILVKDISALNVIECPALDLWDGKYIFAGLTNY